jgi:tRNA(Glu) U13 pseudouridine synthase TruD
MIVPDDERKIITSVLEKEGLTLSDFCIQEETGNFFKTRPRPVLLFPQQFSYDKPIQDELNSKGDLKRYKMKVSFMLPKGSYATVVTKRLFGH